MANTRMKLIAGAVLFCAGAAMASSAMSTTLYGGGATLPAGAYVGFKFLNSTPAGVLTLPADVTSTSIFGSWAGTTNAVQYCQTGSGGGKRVLNGDTSGSPSLTATGTCSPGFPAPAGFSVPTSATVQPDFIGSDAPYSATEYATFVGNKGSVHGEPVQFPSVGGSIAIVFNNSEIGTGTGKILSSLALTKAQVCGIFSGDITDWKTLNSALSSKPISIVFRSDDSGTSFNFGNYLANNCGNVNGNTNHFQTYQTFFKAGSPAVTNTVIGMTNMNASSSKTGVSGNPAVISTVAGTDGTVGYAEAANAQAFNALSTTVTPVSWATVDGKDPIADLNSTLPVTVSFDKTISSAADPTTGKAVLVTQTPNSTANCLGIVDPSTYAVQVGNYPIVAVTYLIANQKGNSTDLTALRSFMAFPQNHAVTAPGFAQLTGTGITAAKALACLAI